jgi:hypothetical protein
VHICKPADPEAKGMIERANGYLETSFLPGRTFVSPADFNTQLADWLVLANGRVKRVLGCAPTARVDADRAAMLALPPIAPATGWRCALRLPARSGEAQLLDDPTPVCFGNAGCPSMVRYGHGQWTGCGAEPELAGCAASAKYATRRCCVRFFRHSDGR